jgi:hypothetical protein
LPTEGSESLPDTANSSPEPGDRSQTDSS